MQWLYLHSTIKFVDLHIWQLTFYCVGKHRRVKVILLERNIFLENYHVY